MDNQADPVAQLADEAGGSAPQLDKAVRKSSATTAESEQDTAADTQASTTVESGPEAQTSASVKSESTATTVQAETNPWHSHASQRETAERFHGQH